jgi:hypothetical protein
LPCGIDTIIIIQRPSKSFARAHLKEISLQVFPSSLETTLLIRTARKHDWAMILAAEAI